MSPRFVLGRENVPCVAEVVNRSQRADCTDFTLISATYCSGIQSYCKIDLDLTMLFNVYVLYGKS